jgi:hypothetical protein
LAKNHGEQSDANILPMGIGNRQNDVPSRHELMLAAADWTYESKPTQCGDQISAFGRRPRGH